MTKVQLSLTQEEAAILSGYGNQFGYSLPKTIKFLISKATENVIFSGLIEDMEALNSPSYLKSIEEARKSNKSYSSSEVKRVLGI